MRWEAQRRSGDGTSHEKRNGQSRRYRERVRSRKPAEQQAVGEAARVITQEYFFHAFVATAPAATWIPEPAALSPATLLFGGVPDTRWRAWQGAGTALEKGARLNPDILIHQQVLGVHSACLMRLEFHQLERRLEHLRARRGAASAIAGIAGRERAADAHRGGDRRPGRSYLVIDGYKRFAALQQLGRDTVEAVVWAMSEAEALLLARSLRLARRKRRWKRLAAGRDGAALRLRARRTGAPFRSQRELGVAAAGAGGVAAGSDPAASARRPDRDAGGAEVSGASGAYGCGAMPADGGGASSSTVATPGKRGNSIRPGAKARARSGSAFSPSRNCF